MTLAEQYMQAGMEKEAGRMGDAAAAARMKAGELGGKLRGVADRTAGAAKGEFGRQREVAVNIAGKGDWDAKGVGSLRRAAGQGAAGAALLGGGALALKKLMAKKSMGQRLVGAMKKNRGALIGGGAAAGGLAGLAAYRKSQSK